MTGLPHAIWTHRQQNCTVHLAKHARDKMLASYAWVQQAGQDNKPVYGVNTGFGLWLSVHSPTQSSASVEIWSVHSWCWSHCRRAHNSSDDVVASQCLGQRCEWVSSLAGWAFTASIKCQHPSQNSNARVLWVQWWSCTFSTPRTNAHWRSRRRSHHRRTNNRCTQCPRTSGSTPYHIGSQGRTGHHQWGTTIHAIATLNIIEGKRLILAMKSPQPWAWSATRSVEH